MSLATASLSPRVMAADISAFAFSASGERGGRGQVALNGASLPPPLLTGPAAAAGR